MARWSNSLQTKDEVIRLKRDAVLRAAGRLFSERGYHSTSLTDVAKQLDVSKGTLYNYVKDKQEILFEFHKMALELGDEAMEVAQQTQGNGRDKLAAGLCAYIAMVHQQLGGYGVIAELGALRPTDRRVVVTKRRRFDDMFLKLLEEGMVDGSLRRVDPRMAIFSFMGALQSLPNWFSPTGRLTAEDVAVQITDLIMCGLAEQRAG